MKFFKIYGIIKYKGVIKMAKEKAQWELALKNILYYKDNI